MGNKLFDLLAVAGALFLIAGPVFAHHAGTAYDRNNPVTVTGTVTEYEFANPHILIHFDVKEKTGAVTRWVAQSGTPKMLFKVGWNRETLKPGDIITLTGFPAKDGRKTITVRNLKPPKGANLTIGAE